MEITGKNDDSSEIFEECNNAEPVIEDKSTEVHDGFNVDDIKFGTISGIKTEPQVHEEFKNYQNRNNKNGNNNHLIVPVGVLVILVTIYLGMSSVQKCLVNCVESTKNSEPIRQRKDNILNYLQKPEILKHSLVVERLLEYKDICRDLEIFTKKIQLTKREEGELVEFDDGKTNDVLKDIEVINSSGANDGTDDYRDEEEGSGIVSSSSAAIDDGSAINGANGNDNCAKTSHEKHKKSKYSIKNTNSKNGFNKYNKSAKAKYQKCHKKDLNLNKKNSTAETIIYLVALYFIYLLLKAASDVNQHYKSQTKNDKRLRRCSLQSYARTHRPDRRASKESALKQKQKQMHHNHQQQQQQRYETLSRSSSQDQTNYHYPHQQTQQHLMDTSEQQQQQQQHISATGSPIRTKVSYANNWQLLRHHTTTQSLDNSDILICSRGGNADLSTSMMARRCSVPAALSYQRQKISTVSPLSIVNDHTNVSINRRTSITSPLPLGMDPIDSLAPETKRRVRMINRH